MLIRIETEPLPCRFLIRKSASFRKMLSSRKWVFCFLFFCSTVWRDMTIHALRASWTAPIYIEEVKILFNIAMRPRGCRRRMRSCFQIGLLCRHFSVCFQTIFANALVLGSLAACRNHCFKRSKPHQVRKSIIIVYSRFLFSGVARLIYKVTEKWLYPFWE